MGAPVCGTLLGHRRIGRKFASARIRSMAMASAQTKWKLQHTRNRRCPLTAPARWPSNGRLGHLAGNGDTGASGPTLAAAACWQCADLTAWLGVGPRHAEPPDRERSRGSILFSVFDGARGYKGDKQTVCARAHPPATRLLPAMQSCEVCAERAAARRVIRYVLEPTRAPTPPAIRTRQTWAWRRVWGGCVPV